MFPYRVRTTREFLQAEKRSLAGALITG